MALKLILISPDGTVGADGKAKRDVLCDLCKFIARMAARGSRSRSGLGIACPSMARCWTRI